MELRDLFFRRVSANNVFYFSVMRPFVFRKKEDEYKAVNISSENICFIRFHEALLRGACAIVHATLPITICDFHSSYPRLYTPK